MWGRWGACLARGFEFWGHRLTPMNTDGENAALMRLRDIALQARRWAEGCAAAVFGAGGELGWREGVSFEATD